MLLQSCRASLDMPLPSESRDLTDATKGVSTEGSGLSKVKTYTTQQMILQVELDTGLALLLNSLEDLL